MDVNRLPKQAYSMMLLQDQNGKRNWVTEIRELLSKIGLDHVWFNQSINNINVFLVECKQRLLDIFVEDWSSKVRSSDRYSLYREFTEGFGKASYVEELDIYCFRVALTQIRVGVLPINKNMNRYGLNPKASMCPFCNDLEEDHKHLLQSCPVYAVFYQS